MNIVNRVFITGDTHGDIDFHKLTNTNWPEQKKLNQNDILIILGDVGWCWDGAGQDRYIQNWYNNKNFITLGILGNHENYDIIEKLPIVDFKGGKAYKLSDKMYYAINGQIYTINGKTYFCMGGAPSHDKFYRTEGVSWWPQEIPNKNQRDFAVANLEHYDYKVDYILTHCGPREIVRDKLGFDPHEYNAFHSFILKYVSFKEWFMGHYHIDRDFPLDQKLKNAHILYDRIIEIV